MSRRFGMLATVLRLGSVAARAAPAPNTAVDGDALRIRPAVDFARSAEPSKAPARAHALDEQTLEHSASDHASGLPDLPRHR